MKEYLKALNALQRMHKLLAQGVEVDQSTVGYYIDDFITQFEMQFSSSYGAARTLGLLKNAKDAATKNQVDEILKLISASNVLI